jgi:7-carboxy-7-deazaguanine synthase
MPNDKRMKTLRITEIFHSIQGESTWAGLPCAFVRLARCPLRCRWCDTTYSFHGGEKKTIREILAALRGYGTPLVLLTGGEPLAQDACIDLAEVLLEEGYSVLIETSGALPIDDLPDSVIKIMDLKCPGSGEEDKNYWPNLEVLNAFQDEVKFVIADRTDYEWSRAVTEEHDLPGKCEAVLFSPVFGELDPADLAKWILEDSLSVRLSLQQHKQIWDPQKRGV